MPSPRLTTICNVSGTIDDAKRLAAVTTHQFAASRQARHRFEIFDQNDRNNQSVRKHPKNAGHDQQKKTDEHAKGGGKPCQR